MRWHQRLGVTFISMMVLLICMEKLHAYQSFDVTFLPNDLCDSGASIQNPSRGFYHILGVEISPSSVPIEEYEKLAQERYENDHENSLAMIQVNLCKFQKTPLTSEGIQNIDNLFSVLEQIEKRWIVRFLYDWSGHSDEYEPEDPNVIQLHMRQVSGVLERHKDIIYTLQGLFFGNWGEMHGSPFATQAYMKQFAEVLAQAVPEDIFISVRMPSQWRSITGCVDMQELNNFPFALRFGLFNDGITGNELDYGTYSQRSRQESSDISPWTRDEELNFQDALCRKVPNGGEIIIDNPLNDFANAVATLSKMHVSYLNWDYDSAVLEKWAAYTVDDGSCFDGQDGLTYMREHLGYRYYVDDVSVKRSWWDPKLLTFSVDFRNDGFAPAYRPIETTLVISDEDGNAVCTLYSSADLCQLAGMCSPDAAVDAAFAMDCGELAAGTYEVYVNCKFSDGERLTLANAQATENSFGVEIGRMVICYNE